MDLDKGNMGAKRVLTQLFNEEAFTTFDILKKHNITGALISSLYKDVCKENLNKMITILDNCENGAITDNQLKHAINNRGAGLDISRY